MRGIVGVIGLGFIGLPLAMCLCEREFHVIGIDVDSNKIDMLRDGISYVQEDYEGKTLTERLKDHLSSGRFLPSSDVRLSTQEASTHIVTVGIPTDPLTSAPDFHPLLDVMVKLGTSLKPGQLVLIRSTVVPGFVENRCVPILEEMSGMVAGVDFHVAYAAERVAEGRAMAEFQTLDIVVGGLTEKCASLATDVLLKLTDGQIHQTDLRVAQLAKVVENAQRDVNLAIVNELKAVAEEHQVDVNELITMVNTHPRVNLLLPSIGVGGYCIPNAYTYLQASVAHKLPLFHTARQVNDEVTVQIADHIVQTAQNSGKQLDDIVVAVFGIGMKDGSNDLRYSPAIRCIEELQSRGIEVRAYDPLVEADRQELVASAEDCVSKADAIVVGAWQPAFANEDWNRLLQLAQPDVIVIDPRQRIRAQMSIRVAVNHQ